MTGIAVAREGPLSAILPMRDAYRREMGCQIVHDSWHVRGFTRSFVLIGAMGVPVGYGAVGGAPRERPDVVKEFWLEPAARAEAAQFFQALVEASGAQRIEAQTNDPFLMPHLKARAVDVVTESLLFAAGPGTSLRVPGAMVRALDDAGKASVFPHTHEPVGDWGLECEGEIVATGGFGTYYNLPYWDLYMEVAPAHRRRGFGSYLVQELQRLARTAGRIPAARCHVENQASRATLERAGMVVCGQIVRGRLASDQLAA